MLKVLNQNKDLKMDVKHYAVYEDGYIRGWTSDDVNSEGLILGKYKTFERAKEIFESMVSVEENEPYLIKEGYNFHFYNKTFKMPQY